MNPLLHLAMQGLTKLVEDRELQLTLSATHEIKATNEVPGNEVVRHEGLELVGDDGKTKFGRKTNGEPIITLVQQANKNLFECFESVFPGVSTFELQPEVISRYQLYSQRDSEADAATLRNLEHGRVVLDWLAGFSSGILWVYRHRQPPASDWMTKFSLRVIYPTVVCNLDVFERDSSEQSSTIFTLHIFCGLLLQSTTSHKLSVCGILQSLIVQAFDRVWSLECNSGRRSKGRSIKFRRDCQDLGLVVHRLAEAKSDPKLPFEILASLLRLIDSNCLFIVIDGIHHLGDDGIKDSELTGDLQQVLSSLAELTADNDFIVKTLITSRAPFTPDIMEAEVARFDVPFHEIKVDRQVPKASPRAKRVAKRKFRLEQESKTNEAHQRRILESLEAGDDSILDQDIDQIDHPRSDSADSDADSFASTESSSDSGDSVHSTSDDEGDGKCPAADSDHFSESSDSDSADEATSPTAKKLKPKDSLEDLVADSIPSSPTSQRSAAQSFSDRADGDNKWALGGFRYIKQYSKRW